MTIVFDGEAVTILPKRAPVGASAPIRGRSVAVFPVETSAAGAYAATVEPGARAGHALLDLSEAEARARGAALGLDEILYWDGRRAQVMACR